MKVGVTYTGVNGKSTSFSSTSASGALKRLSRIEGYSGGESDRIAAGLASGWRERHQAAARQRMGEGGVHGLKSNDIRASRGGIAGGVSTISSIGMSGGKLTAVTQKHFINEQGATVGVGPKREITIGGANGANAGLASGGQVTESQVRKIVAGELKDSAATKAAEKIDNATGIDVVTGITFNVDDEGMTILVTKARANVLSIGNAETVSQRIGESLMVHEDVNTQEHSHVVVLKRRKVVKEE